jgi:hypothetical protein
MKITWLQWGMSLAFLITHLDISLYSKSAILIHYPFLLV